MGYIQSDYYHGPLDFSDLVSGLQQMIEADRDGDVELAAAYAEDLADPLTATPVY